jgi:hypothetical protein
MRWVSEPLQRIPDPDLLSVGRGQRHGHAMRGAGHRAEPSTEHFYDNKAVITVKKATGRAAQSDSDIPTENPCRRAKEEGWFGTL